MIILMGRRRAFSVVAEQVISLGDCHIATRDGEAMFFHDSLDFSAYAGTDLGSTPYYLEFVDSTGLVAAAYAGAAGGGETLETNETLSFDSGLEDIKAVFGDETATFTHDTDKASLVVSIAGTRSDRPSLTKNNFANVAENSLCRFELDYTVNSGAVMFTGVNFIGYKGLYENLTGSDTYISYYKSMVGSTYTYLIFYFSGKNVFDLDLLEIRHKHLTDIPATGLHLMSVKNGTTRNMASQETGFDPNNIAEIRIWRV